jgi:hypothetical protein
MKKSIIIKSQIVPAGNEDESGKSARCHQYFWRTSGSPLKIKKYSRINNEELRHLKELVEENHRLKTFMPKFYWRY